MSIISTDKTISNTYTLADKAKEYALKSHRKVNQMYGEYPYEHHLNMVNEVYHIFKTVIPFEDRDYVEAALWLHDVIEDTGETYNDVLKKTNKKVADLVFALTNEKGRNRSERSNSKYYRSLRTIEYGTFCKICDKFANIKSSVETGHGMIKAHRKELKKFIHELYSYRYFTIFFHLSALLHNDVFTEPKYGIFTKLNRKLDKPILWVINKLSNI
jgi:(p)ppGpp synthase/HD superfamily hydrolase